MYKNLTKSQTRNFKVLEKFFRGKDGEFCRSHKDFEYYCKLLGKQGMYNWHDIFGKAYEEMIKVERKSLQ